MRIGNCTSDEPEFYSIFSMIVHKHFVDRSEAIALCKPSEDRRHSVLDAKRWGHRDSQAARNEVNLSDN